MWKVLYVGLGWCWWMVLHYGNLVDASTCVHDTMQDRRVQADINDQSILRVIEHVAPKIQSTDPISFGILKAPIHMACQMKKYPALQNFIDSNRYGSKLQLKPYAQPPHIVFYDQKSKVVEVLPILSKMLLSDIQNEIQTRLRQ